jgi:6-methylsalicylate decarboxylase
MLDWTAGRSIEDMDRAGVATSMTSITTPGVWFGDNREARILARECNEYAARLAGQYPGRFGIFASLPLPDVDGSLEEIAYAFDVLHADGIGVMTSFGDKWLGDEAFAPVMQELNRRKAIIYTHPTAANCCRNLQPEVHYSIIELATDTSRAIASLVFSGAAARYPDITFIFSHAGGTMPFIYQRFARYPGMDRALGLGLDIQGKVPKGVAAALRAFYYDTAQAAHPMAMGPLVKLVSSSQVLFGTDFPFGTATDHAKGLADCDLSSAEIQAIYRENAVRLMPKLEKAN